MAARTRTPRVGPRLASDNLRSTVAALIALGLSVAVSFVAGFISARAGVDEDELLGLRTSALYYFGFWIGYSLIFMAMTWQVFRRADAGTLAAWLRESTSQRRARRLREALAVGSGPLAGVTFAATAMVVVLIVALTPELRSDALVVAMSAGVVVVSWLLLVTVYTVHYAREEAHTGQLEFPGAGDGPTLHDYLYLAVQISTTFSASDVTIAGTSMRRTVSAHAIVAFAFNSVIVALLVSLLIAGIG